ncbi:MAG: SLBB domain-containing protein, partial [Bacteroidota bacterium]
MTILFLSICAEAQEVDVDKLSDAQIEAFVEDARRRGLSEQELVLAARARGIPPEQIDKMRLRISQLQSGGSGGGNVTDIDRTRPEGNTVGGASVQASSGSGTPDNEQVFGMQIFQSSSPAFQPSSNIPTPQNYQLGVGDQIIIDIWGASEKTYQLTISPEGSIRISGIGPVYINGLSIESASAKIKRKLKSSIYNRLGIDTYADITLGKLKSIKVSVIGEVRKQGTYQLSSFSTVFNALYAAGGPGKNGSFRNVGHYRNGKKINEIDLYDLFFYGSSLGITLQDQDILIVKPYSTRVQIVGSVKRTGYFEMLPGEHLDKLLEYAGGFTNKAYREKLTVKRISGIKRSIKTVDADEFSTFELSPGDQVSVTEIIERYENRIRIEGAVFKPGEYEFIEGTTLSGLIKLAEGVREDAFYGRGSILRLNEDLSLKLISFDVAEV